MAELISLTILQSPIFHIMKRFHILCLEEQIMTTRNADNEVDNLFWNMSNYNIRILLSKKWLKGNNVELNKLDISEYVEEAILEMG